MKRFIKYIIFILLVCAPLRSDASNNEFLAQELLNNTQAGEVNLSLAPDSGMDAEEKLPVKDFSPQVNSGIDDDDDDDEDDMIDSIEEEFKFFDKLGRDKNANIEAANFFKKVMKSKITRTDIPSFLLRNQLTVDYEKGPIDEAQYYLGYRGSLSGLLSSRNYSTKYDNMTTEVGVYGKFKNPHYDFKLKLRPIPKDGVDYIDQLIGDAYIVNTQIPNHRIIAGFSRVQTGVEGGVSSFILPFAARSQIARTFGNARSLAVKVIGNYNYADYSISAGSSGRYITSGMPGAEFNGWLNIKPFGTKDGKYGKLTLGGGINTGHNRNDYTVGSVYVGYKHKQLWTNFEAAVADGYSGSTGISDKKASGLTFTLGWKLKPYLQLIGRVDSFDPDRHVNNNRKNEYTIGLNWFIKGQALKLIFNYVFCQNQNAPDGHRFIMATQVML